MSHKAVLLKASSSSRSQTDWIRDWLNTSDGAFGAGGGGGGGSGGSGGGI